MRKIIVSLLAIAFLCSACVEHSVFPRPNDMISVPKENVEILGHTEGKTGGGRIWILFIPIGWGRDEVLETIAYKKALKHMPNAEGLIDKKVTYTRVRVPLVLVTYVGKAIKIEGTAFRIKTNTDYQQEITNKTTINNNTPNNVQEKEDSNQH